MRKALLCCAAPLCAAAAFGAENNDENAAREGLWNNLHVYRAFNQRGGPYLTDDSYLEWEFGGRKGVLDLYGYIDYKNLFDDASSDVPDGENWFVDIEPRLSIDRLLGRDFSIGPIREWFVAFD
ncbi:outer membrane protein OmpK, partial [Pseudomonas aeruginosa]